MTATNIMDTYKRLPVTFSHGDGAWLYDTNGNKYLDALCGISVTSLGHNHPAVTTAIKHQAENLLHTSNLYHIEAQQQAAEKLCEISAMDKVFFGNSGAEANEAAIKLARLHGNNQGIDTPTIITAEGSFHGRTMATLTATGNDAIKKGFEPLLPGFIQVPFNDLAAIETVAQQHSNIVAVLLEPVQGEGGIHVADTDYLRALQQFCTDKNWLFMLDEIQTGNGRCGSYFAYQALGLQPDVVTTAKGLGNGVPVGACLARGEAASVLGPGNHGSTFGGNPLACAAALAVINTIESENLAGRAAELGEFMRNKFASNFAECTAVTDIRGMGLMIGIELDRPCSELVEQALQAGLLLNVTANSVIRLLPPLIVSEDEANNIVDIVSRLVLDFTSTS